MVNKNPEWNTHKAFRKKYLPGTVLIWVFFVMLILLSGFVYTSVQVVTHGQQAISSLKRAQTHLYAFQFESASEELQRARASFESAKKYTPFLKFAFVIPVVGTPLSQSGLLIQDGEDVVDTLLSLSDIGIDVFALAGMKDESSLTFADISPESKELVLSRLQASSNTFSVLSSRISLIKNELADVPLSFKSLRDEDLSRLQTTLEDISLFTNVISSLLGVTKPAHYLVLFQNNTELRPGGGFIGNYGVATVSKADLQSIKTADVYALDRTAEGKLTDAAPYPLAVYNQTPHLYFRDANWSPDFSVSAESLLKQFQKETSFLSPEERLRIPFAESFDGVIAFTPTFISTLLEEVGDITVAGQTFTAKNMTDTLEYQVEYGYKKQGIPETQRKELIGQLMDILVQRLTEKPLNEWGNLYEHMEKGFREKHLFVYSTHPEVEDIFTKIGWSGRVDPQTSDVQMVVDANLASLKTDPAVERAITYEITKNEKGERVGRTSIQYKHTGTFDWKTTRYRTYTRLYVPLGSKLLRVIGSSKNDEFTDLGLTAFGAFIEIEPKETKTLVFEYILSDAVRTAIANDTYSLQVFKQGGAQNHALTLDLDFGKNVMQATPSEDSVEWGDTKYHLNTILDQDKEFNVGLSYVRKKNWD